MNSFVLAITLSLSATVLARIPTMEDLYNALDTGERIWTVYRSYTRQTRHQNHTCVYNSKFSLFRNNYRFGQYYKLGSDWSKHALYANLIEEVHRGDGPVLFVSRNKTGPHGIPYTLRYWNRKDHCGILTFSHLGNTECELHVWENSEKQRVYVPKACKRQYRRSCRKRMYSVFSDECLKTLH